MHTHISTLIYSSDRHHVPQGVNTSAADCERFLFPGPHFAAVNNNNEIIVTDFHNHSVKVSYKN